MISAYGDSENYNKALIILALRSFTKCDFESLERELQHL
jgi:RNase P protein component